MLSPCAKQRIKHENAQHLLNSLLNTRTFYPSGCPIKMFLKEKGGPVLEEHFFWDTWYTIINKGRLKKK